MGLKKIIINYGLNLIVDNAFDQLKKYKDVVIIYLEDAFIRLVNGLTLDRLVKLGASPEQAQFLKDKGVLFARGFIAVLISIVIAQGEVIAEKVIQKIKL